MSDNKLDNIKKRIRLPVTWEVCGFVEVESNTIKEAVEHFITHSDGISLPDDSDYVDGSFQLTSLDEDFIALYQEEG